MRKGRRVGDKCMTCHQGRLCDVAQGSSQHLSAIFLSLIGQRAEARRGPRRCQARPSTSHSSNSTQRHLFLSTFAATQATTPTDNTPTPTTPGRQNENLRRYLLRSEDLPRQGTMIPSKSALAMPPHPSNIAYQEKDLGQHKVEHYHRVIA